MSGRVVLGTPSTSWHLLPFDLHADAVRCGAALPSGAVYRNEEDVPAARLCGRCLRVVARRS